MTMNKKLKITLLTIPVILIVCTIAFGSFYTYWNTASPDETCASCHEIGKSVHSQAESAHRDLHCKECHGTALSNGIHSMKEKGMMVVNHITDTKVENVKMNEQQMLELLQYALLHPQHMQEMAKKLQQHVRENYRQETE